MSIGSALAKVEDIKRRVFLGKKTTLYLYNRETDTVVGKVKVWNVQRLNTLDSQSPNHKFFIKQDKVVCTPENLTSCMLIFNGMIHDVLDRDDPLGERELLWYLLTRPTGQTKATS